MRKNYRYVLFVLCLYWYLFMDIMDGIIPYSNYFDEIIAILAAPLFCLKLKSENYKLKISIKSYEIYIVIFTLIGLISILAYRYQPLILIALPGLFLQIKFWFSVYVGRVVFGKLDINKYSSNIFAHVKFIVIALFFLTVLNYAFKIFPSTYRYGILANQLFYRHATTLSAMCIMLVSVLIMIKKTEYKENKIIIYLWLLIFILITTLRSKAIGGAFTIVFIYYWVFAQRKEIKIKTLVTLIPFVVFLAWEQIYFYFFSSIQSDSARYQLLVKSFEVANDHFPLGAGFGSYATYFSGVNYSPLYNEYGLSNVYGLRIDNTAFISDVYWPAIIGEAGWIGTGVVLIALYFVFKKIQQLNKINISYYVSALIIFMYLIIVSIAESAFMHPNMGMMALILGMFFEKTKNQTKIS